MVSDSEASTDTLSPLAGCTVVVTRAAEQAGPFVRSLRSLGAAVIEIPVIRIVDPADGGEEMRRKVTALGTFEWVVLTSPNAADRFFRCIGAQPSSSGRAGGPGVPSDVRVACVGPGTAAVVQEHGGRVDLVADRSVGEGLVASFPSGTGRVLLPRAAVARTVVADGLRVKGWTVVEVDAYRTEPVAADPSLGPAVRTADVIAFTSSSTVRAFVAAAGRDSFARAVVSIGPETTATLAEFGVLPTRTAAPHTLDGLLAAIVDVRRSGGL